MRSGQRDETLRPASGEKTENVCTSPHSGALSVVLSHHSERSIREELNKGCEDIRVETVVGGFPPVTAKCRVQSYSH